MHRSFMVLAITVWPALSLAQDAPPPTTAAANPSAAVSPLVYRSAFDATSTGIEKGTEDWKAANAAVGQFTRGHRDVYKWEQTHEMAAEIPPAPASVPAHAH